MMDVAHIGFILGAYGVTAVVLAGLVAAVWLDGRTQSKILAKLEALRPGDQNKGSRP